VNLPPIVYVGPSLDPQLVGVHLPGAQVMPPVRRADLYRDRMLGFSFFVILDGVFFQQLAIPPREVLDVIADGGTVVGASSMGAIRAAECWPAGMRGIGTIYRLLRRGSLRSDDEVAVVFGTENPHLQSSVPLVNVRYALSRALHKREIERRVADRIIAAAECCFYAERNWPNLLEQAGIEDSNGMLRHCLASYDLKGLDAVRALKASARLLRREHTLLDRPRRTNVPFRPSELTRERTHDAFGPAGEASLRPGVWSWLRTSGRIKRYLHFIPELTNWANLGLTGDVLPAAAWRHLEDLGELDALAYRYRAIMAAAIQAREDGLVATSRHHHQAQMEIALEHQFPSWEALRDSLAGNTQQWRDIRAYRDTLSLAKCLRDKLFGCANSDG